MHKQELKKQKSALTREINDTQKEIDWITKDDNPGKEPAKYYLGELRFPQLLRLKRDLSIAKFRRKKLEAIVL